LTGAGVAGAGTGTFCSIGAGCEVLVGTDRALLYIIANMRLLNMNTTTTTVVILVMKPDEPELPKSV